MLISRNSSNCNSLLLKFYMLGEDRTLFGICHLGIASLIGSYTTKIFYSRIILKVISDFINRIRSVRLVGLGRKIFILEITGSNPVPST